MATGFQDLFPEARNPPELQAINDRCQIRTQDGHRVVMVAGIGLAHYATADRLAEAHAMVSLVAQGWAEQNDGARAFGYSARTLRRDQRRYAEGGLAAPGQPRGHPAGRARRTTARRQTVHRLKTQGHSPCEIARRLGISETAVRKLLIRLGGKEHPDQPDLLPLEAPANSNPKLSAFYVAAPPPAPARHDPDPRDRSADRLLARLGLLEDAPPRFGSAAAVPRAGVLLALPVLLASGVFECAQKIHGTPGPSFDGLRTRLLTLLLMALWRIKRPENLKAYSPQRLGRVLGRDRAPEVKTLRRKLASLAATGRAAQLGDALARRRVALRGKAPGLLYGDGHVRVCHGQPALPKAHVARLRLALPATSDCWVNDRSGDPLFVVTAAANAGLVKMLPGLLDQVRRRVGQRRGTVGFDRGGFSPKRLPQILAAGFDLLTWRKGRHPRIPRARFGPHTARLGGRKVSYVLADQEVRLLKGKLRLRQVTRRMENGHQTPILTSRRDLGAAHVAYRMFDRWRQANFCKYLREAYALEALVAYAAVPDDPNREGPNPVWTALDAQLHPAWARVDRLQSASGLEALNNLERKHRTMRGFKIAYGKLGDRIGAAWQRVLQLEKRRAAVPRRVPVGEAADQPIVTLAPERKPLTNLIKMVACQAASDLLRRVAPHSRRADDEGRTLIPAALASAADLQVTKRELRVLLAPQSSPHRTRALAALCEELNQSKAAFPGSKLRLICAIQEPS